MISSLDEIWKSLSKLPNVIGIFIGTKWKEGKDTGIPCVTIFVKKKISRSLLSPSDLIPPEISGIITDVIELNTSDFVMGDTSVSKEMPSQILRRIRGVIKE